MSRAMSIRLFLAASCALGILLCPEVHGAGPEQPPAPKTTPATREPEPPPWANGPDAQAILTRLSIGSLAILGLCGAILYAGKRWLRTGAGEMLPGQQLQILETLRLGNRCSVLLVQAADQQLLVGLDASGMKSLLGLPAEIDQFNQADSVHMPSPDYDPWASP